MPETEERVARRQLSYTDIGVPRLKAGVALALGVNERTSLAWRVEDDGIYFFCPQGDAQPSIDEGWIRARFHHATNAAVEWLYGLPLHRRQEFCKQVPTAADSKVTSLDGFRITLVRRRVEGIEGEIEFARIVPAFV
jgi:hypothetical protein